MGPNTLSVQWLITCIACALFVLPRSTGQCVDGMARACNLQSLNMLTDGMAILRNIPGGKYYAIVVEQLKVSANPAGPFLQRISEFVDHVELNAYHEQVFQVPPGTNLKTVNIFQANGLRQMVIGADVTFTSLVVSSCLLNRIPPTIGQLLLLESLSITFCALRSLTFDVFVNSSRLTNLDLSDNAIEVVLKPNLADKQLAIEDLSLASNRLTYLDMTVFEPLSALRMLDLRNNSLETVAPDHTITWPALEMFDLSENVLRAVDLQWLVAPKLQHLALGGNRLQAIPQRLRRFPTLQLVDFSENNFTGFDLAPLTELPELNTLALSGNPMARYVRSSRPMRLPMLNTLYVESCTLSRFNTTGMDLPMISFVSLAHNNFSTVPPLGQTFPALESFSLLDNPLTCATLKARAETLLSGKLIIGASMDPKDCGTVGSVTIKGSLSFCCKA